MADAPHQAVFLSYASQDAAAAKKICDALRAAGVEVWFDQSELRGGDAWDAKIRKQIKDCALFMPVISTNTQARTEGYFRLEWKLAVDRSHLMADDAAFLFPVVIDDTSDAAARVPDKFREVQWTRLNVKETPESLAARVASLLGGPGTETGARAADITIAPRKARASKRALLTVVLPIFGVAMAMLLLLRDREPKSAPAAKPSAASVAAPGSEARQLARKAQDLINALDGTRDDHRFAEELVHQAEAKDPTDAEVLAIEAQLHARFIIRGWDDSNARLEAGRVAVQKALRLDPQSYEARFADAALLSFAREEGREKEAKLRVLLQERPQDKRVLRMLAETIERQDGRLEESLPFFDAAAALPGGDPLALYSKSMAYWFDGRTAEADAALQAALAQKPFIGAKLVAAWYALLLHGDVARARSLLAEVPPQTLREDRAAFFAFMTEFWGRNWAVARGRLLDVPHDWLNDAWYRGPKSLLIGDTYRAQGRLDAAKLEWQTALKLVDERRAASPNDRTLLATRLALLARLGEKEAAGREAKLLEEATGLSFSGDKPVPIWVSRLCVELGRNAETIRQISLGLKQRFRAVEHTSWELKLSPDWDPLRGDPAFAAVIAEAEAIEKGAAR